MKKPGGDKKPAALIARRKRAVEASSELARAARELPGEFDEAALEAIKQKAFELAIAPGAKATDVKQFFSLLLAARAQSRSQEKLLLDQAKFELDATKYREQVAAQKKKIEDAMLAGSRAGGVSKETFEQVERELKLL